MKVDDRILGALFALLGAIVLWHVQSFPVIPGQKWRVHDKDRPRPAVVTPGSQYGQPPSDAINLRKAVISRVSSTTISLRTRRRRGS